MLRFQRHHVALLAGFLGVTLVVAGCHKKGKVDSGGGSTPPPGAPPVNGSTLALYNDAGGVLGQSNVLLFTGGGVQIQEQTGTAAEGNKFLHSTSMLPGAFWGITFDKNNSGQSRDLSTFSNGGLRFWIRVNRAVGASEKIQINLTDKSGFTQTVQLNGAVNFDGSKTGTWQDISIPLSAYNQIALNAVKVPFAIAIGSPSGTPDVGIDIDNVRWEVPYQDLGGADSGIVTGPGGGGGGSPPVSADPGSGPNYAVYNDGGGILGDPQVLLFTGGGLQIAELTGGAAEGNKYLRSTQAGPGAFFGFTVDKNNSGRTIDLSGWSVGHITFSIRIDRTLGSGEVVNVNLTDGHNTTQSVALGSSVGFSASSAGSWQNVSIPVSQYSQIDFARVRVPFAVALNFPAGSSNVILDVDNIVWTR